MTWGAIGASVIGVVGGGLLGGQESTSGQSVSKELPPELKAFIYGKNGQGGLLNDAAGVYNQQLSQGGLNDMQRGGMEAQRQFLTSPQYTQGYEQMRQQGMDLMGRPVAGNPFTSGNTGGMGGYGLLTAQGAGGQAGHPSGNTSQFQYSPNQSLLGALNPMQSAPPQALPTAPAASAAPSLDEIIAELMRQQQSTANNNYQAGGG